MISDMDLDSVNLDIENLEEILSLLKSCVAVCKCRFLILYVYEIGVFSQ